MGPLGVAHCARVTKGKTISSLAIPEGPRMGLGQARNQDTLKELADHCASAIAIGQHFAARDYYPAMLFNLTHRPRTIIRLDLFGAVVIAQQDGNRLLIEDLLPTRPFRLKDALPYVCAKPVRTLEFGFHPEAWWPNAESQALDDGGSPLSRGAWLWTSRGPSGFPTWHKRK